MIRKQTYPNFQDLATGFIDPLDHFLPEDRKKQRTAAMRRRLDDYREDFNRGRVPVLADGDSWFSIICSSAGIPDVLEHEHRYAVLNLAVPGGELGQLADPDRFKRLRDALNMMVAYDPGNPNDPGTLPPARFVLLSGGGNEIIGTEFRSYLIPESETASTDPTDRIRWTDFNATLKDLKTAIEGFCGTIRETLGAEVPVLVHGYDYVKPRNKPQRCPFATLGPWIHPALVDEEINILDEENQEEIVKLLLDSFTNDVIQPLKMSGTIHHVDLLGTLQLDMELFADEIHPNFQGMKELAKKFDDVIQEILAA